MELKQLKSFLVAADTLNFSKTAEQLNFAQSSISDQIRLLEEEFECKLFERLGRKLTLTKEGETLRKYAERILFLSEEAKNNLTNKLKPMGDLRIVIAETLCVFRLPALFSTFYQNYPDVNLKISIRNCVDFPDLLRSNMADIAFSLEDDRVYHDIEPIDLIKEELVLVAAKEDILSKQKNIQLSDLNSRNLILTQKGCSYRIKFEQYLAEYKIHPKSVLEMETIEGIKRYVKNGFGISFLPKIVVDEELKSGEFVELQYDGPTFYTSAKILYHKNKWITPAIRELIELATSTYN